MPNYDYHCNNCNNNFSLFLAIKDRDQAECPKCHSTNVKQRFTRCAYNLGFGPHRVPDIKKIEN